MASSGPDRSIAGISIPQWMKSRISDRYDLEQSAFSPPSEDDGFFLIRYPKAKSVEPEPKVVTASNFTPLTQVLESHRDQTKAFTQHTIPCQQVISQTAASKDTGLGRPFDPSLGRIKSMGTDDGFKGEGAACGYSVVAVAQQMLSERGGTLACPKYERLRRNSKSLPASPQSSPKLLRKNPYFTNILFGSIETVDSDNNPIKKSSGLLSAAIESQRSSSEDLTSNQTGAVGSHVKLSSLPEGDTHFQPEPKPVSKAFRAKPSELREMNFWSPTSM